MTEIGRGESDEQGLQVGIFVGHESGSGESEHDFKEFARACAVELRLRVLAVKA